jgi:Anticodon binding domain
LYKVKPKLNNQFKAAEVNGVPMAVVIGEDEVAQGKVKIKEMGLREGHPEKDGVLVNLADIVPEIRQRLRRKANLDKLVQEAEGLRVVDGIKGDPGKVESAAEKSESVPEKVDSVSEKVNIPFEEVKSEPAQVESAPKKEESLPQKVDSVPEKVNATLEEVKSSPEKVESIPGKVNNTGTEKPAEETPLSQEAVPAS